MKRQINNGHLQGGEDFVQSVSNDEISPCYLFIGQHPLTAPLVQRLITALIGEASLEFNLETIAQEACTAGAVLEAVKTRPFSPGRKVVLLQDPPFLTSAGADGRWEAEAQDWEKVFLWLSSQKDIRSILVIESDCVDKRIGAFSRFKRLGPVVIDVGIGGDSSKDTKNAASAYVNGLLQRAGKKADKGVVDLILDQVGHDPVALGIEIDKLISLAGPRERIGLDDVREAISRQREEEVFRLADAILRRDKASAFEVISRLLADDVHPLIILQTIANFLRKMALILAALSDKQGVLSMQGMTYQVFQKEILPNLKAFWGEPAPHALKGLHPYALYIMYRDAHRFRLEKVLELFARLPDVDLALKGGQCPSRVILERLILEIIER
ncbi:MAG: DNA polymerase III subunit delta [Dissulfurimicrobium sp.]|uniref:DNA polymerase III subunit delta n=1 Tax=Dissulfurimicrobium hydrothermale TaxID=1750598 RepID=UPI003C75B4B6